MQLYAPPVIIKSVSLNQNKMNLKLVGTDVEKIILENGPSTWFSIQTNKSKKTSGNNTF